LNHPIFLLNIHFDDTNDDNLLFERMTNYLNTNNIINYNILSFEQNFTFTTKERLLAEMELIEQFATSRDYILLSDIDEFQDWNKFGVENIYNFIQKELILNGKEYASGYLVDRFADYAILKDPISKYDASYSSTPSIFEQYPWRCDFTQYVLNGYNEKLVLFKNVYLIHNGHHFVVDRKKKYKNTRLRFSFKNRGNSILKFNRFEIPIHHFKWNKNVIYYLQKRIKMYKQKGYHWWIQSKNAVEWLQENSGSIDLGTVNAFNCSYSVQNNIIKSVHT